MADSETKKGGIKITDLIKNNYMPDLSQNKLGFEVSDRVQLEHVRQVKGNFEHQPAAGKGAKSVDIDTTTKFEVDKENKLIFVFADFELEAHTDEIEEPVVNVSASFLLMYEMSDIEGFTDDHYEQFAKMNGVFNAWPYWREYVQNVTVRMGLPALTVPVFRVFKPKPKQDDHCESD